MGREALAMTLVFLAGPLADTAMQSAVLGSAVAGRAARLPGHALRGDPCRPVARPADGQSVAGLAARLDDDQLARLVYWMAGQPGALATLATDNGPVQGLAWTDVAASGPDWSPADWALRWQPLAILAAAEILAQRGLRPPQDALRRWPQVLTRAGARLRAAEPAPATLRHRARPGDIDEQIRSQPYAQYFAVEEYDLRHRRFDGRLSPVLNRAVFISGDAVVVLPYDPRHDRVLVIEQFRAGPHGRGDPQPWLVETVAGRIDAGETPEATALREAQEEAGVHIDRLLPVADYYPSPAAKAEFIYSFIGLCDLSATEARIGGLEAEGEDIRAHAIPFARLMDMVASGEVANAPLLICALWLEKRRADLRAAAGA
jgi:ADP-ribose pyrophosphatase